MPTEDQNKRKPGPIRLERDGVGWAMDGYPSFMGQPICIEKEDLEAANPDVVIMGSPWDGSMGMPPGTRHAAAAIRSVEPTGSKGGDWTHPTTRVNPLEVLNIVDYGDVAIVHGAPEESFRRIRERVAEIIGIGSIPILLGGDHSVTWPHVQGLTAVFGKGNVGVVHFDAHADTWPLDAGQYTSHGSGMRQLIDGGDVAGENFVQVGLRSSTDHATLQYMEERGMRSHWMAEIEQKGFDAVAERAIEEALAGPEHLFLSVDVDVCDPAHAPGTGAPEPGGISSGQLLAAVRRICHEVGISGMDVVEVSPPYDVGVGITAMLAHRCVYEALTGTAMRKSGDFAPNYGHDRPRNGPPSREGGE